MQALRVPFLENTPSDDSADQGKHDRFNGQTKAKRQAQYADQLDVSAANAIACTGNHTKRGKDSTEQQGR